MKCLRCKARAFTNAAGAVSCLMCGWTDYATDNGKPVYQHSTLAGIPRNGKYPATTPRVVTRLQQEAIRAAKASLKED